MYTYPSRVFGSTCFVHNIALRKDKLVPRALKYVFLDYSRVQKGHCCYSPNLRRCLMSTDVTFFKSQPYYTFLIMLIFLRLSISQFLPTLDISTNNGTTPDLSSFPHPADPALTMNMPFPSQPLALQKGI